MRVVDGAAPGPRVVLIVGGSSGIGAATALKFCADGYSVALLSRSREALEKVAATLPSPAMVLPADITDADALAAAVHAVLDEYGRLDAVVHTAQVMAYGRIEDVPQEVFEHVVDVAMHGTANLARTVLPIFRTQAHGTLVIVNSLLGQIATPRMGSYDAAKWGQLGLARVLQLEVRSTPGVAVCIVSPGAINTPIYDQAANYAGQSGFAPPPVIAPERVAEAIHRCMQHPRRHVNVGPANRIIVLGFQLLPAFYDRIIGPIVDRVHQGCDLGVGAPVRRLHVDHHRAAIGVHQQ